MVGPPQRKRLAQRRRAFAQAGDSIRVGTRHALVGRHSRPGLLALPGAAVDAARLAIGRLEAERRVAGAKFRIARTPLGFRLAVATDPQPPADWPITSIVSRFTSLRRPKNCSTAPMSSAVAKPAR
jgi:hypothetical protein